MTSAKVYAAAFGLGALTYWGADIALHWMSSEPPVVLLTFCVPPLVAGVYKYVAGRPGFRDHGATIPISMLLGIWAMGPLALAIGMTHAGATFLEPQARTQFFALWALFPFATFVMATYSGSLGGLLLTTFGLLVVAFVPPARRALLSLQLNWLPR